MTEENQENPSFEEANEAAAPAEKSVEAELLECKDKYLRLLAESENTRKRLQKEKVDMMRFSTENAILEFLSPIENLEMALSFTSQMSDETANWAKGFQMILGQFKEALSNNGITAFHAMGTFFDPHLHEAVETEESESCQEGEILQEYCKGYKSAHRTIRPARVKVAKKPKTQEETTQN